MNASHTATERVEALISACLPFRELIHQLASGQTEAAMGRQHSKQLMVTGAVCTAVGFVARFQVRAHDPCKLISSI